HVIQKARRLRSVLGLLVVEKIVVGLSQQNRVRSRRQDAWTRLVPVSQLEPKRCQRVLSLAFPVVHGVQFFVLNAANRGNKPAIFYVGLSFAWHSAILPWIVILSRAWRGFSKEVIASERRSSRPGILPENYQRSGNVGEAASEN